MSFVVDLHRDDSVLEIFAVRRILEPAAAALAAQRMADDATIAELRAVLDERRRRARTSRTWSPTTWSSTAASRAPSGNPYLARLLDALSEPAPCGPGSGAG